MTKILDKNSVPETAAAQLQKLARLLREALEEALLGLILHGSAASAGFESARSDLDVLAIVDGELSPAQRETIGRGILRISNQPHPIEISVVGKRDLDNWSHPCNHQLHYGEDLREQFSAASFMPESPRDEDLAMHFTLARARGRDLLGTYPVERLPAIPRRDYLCAILSDFEWAKGKADLHQYAVANACRTMAYLHSGALLSKSEGIEWCRANAIAMSGIVDEVKTRLRLELGV